MEPDEYCREIERHLCRRNDGHLIRIVGPSFDRVRGWAERGVPLTIALHGIDRHFERYYSRGPRRRPVHIDHCDADVMDVFDEWRRAVGVRGVAGANGQDAGAAEGDEDPVRRQPSLRAHVDRLIARLTALRSSTLGAPVDRALEAAVRELDGLRDAARTARGEAREDLTARLGALDLDLMIVLRDAASPADLGAVADEARSALAPFRQRMTEDAYARALETSVQRLLRVRAGLPRLAPD